MLLKSSNFDGLMCEMLILVIIGYKRGYLEIMLKESFAELKLFISQ